MRNGDVCILIELWIGNIRHFLRGPNWTKVNTSRSVWNSKPQKHPCGNDISKRTAKALDGEERQPQGLTGSGGACHIGDKGHLCMHQPTHLDGTATFPGIRTRGCGHALELQAMSLWHRPLAERQISLSHESVTTPHLHEQLWRSRCTPDCPPRTPWNPFSFKFLDRFVCFLIASIILQDLKLVVAHGCRAKAIMTIVRSIVIAGRS